MTTKELIIDYLEKLLRWTYTWLSDRDEILGKILYSIHLFTLLVIIVMILVSHIIYPIIWLQIGIFIVVLVIWLQHILLKTCVCSSLERKLMGGDARLAVDTILEMFKIPVTKETRVGITILLSTICVMFLGLELIARGVTYLRERVGASPWI